MSLNHQLSERVYRSLKVDVLGGILGSGRLNLASLEARYASSATPVREALLRLVGERLVDILPRGGFGVHTSAHDELSDLYRLNSRILCLVKEWRPKRALGPDPGEFQASSLTPPIDTFFLSLAETTQSSLYVALVDALNDRLHRIRITENRLLRETCEEYTLLQHAAAEPGQPLLTGLLRTYHRRRIKAARIISGF